MPAARAALVVGLLLLLAGACGGGGDGDGTTGDDGGDLAALATPLLEAHDALLAYARAVQDGEDRAAAERWPEVEATVTRALEDASGSDAGHLAPAQRSALTGFAGGLRLARDALADVQAAIEAGDSGSRDRAATFAADRLRHLDSLRPGIEATG